MSNIISNDNNNQLFEKCNNEKLMNVFTLIIEPNLFASNNLSSTESLTTTTALEDQQRLTKDLEERRAKAEQDRILLERERVEAEKKASQIADIANEEKEKMV